MVVWNAQHTFIKQVVQHTHISLDLNFYFTEDVWDKAEVEGGDFEPLVVVDEGVEHHYAKEFSGCGREFQIRSPGDGKLCWGGAVIIGVAIALVVIIAIIIGVS